MEEAKLDVVAGRFDAALARLTEASRATAADPLLTRELGSYGQVLALRVEVLRETGAEAAARDAARELTDRLDLLAQGVHGSVGDIGNYWWVVRAAGLPLDPARREWADEKARSGRLAVITWTQAWALPAATRDEAVAALAGDAAAPLPRGGEWMNWRFDGDAATGHLLALAERYGEAVPFLRRATGNCFLREYPIAHTRASQDLGQALEHTGDTAGACVAYRKAVNQWGHATPRSITGRGQAGDEAARVQSVSTNQLGRQLAPRSRVECGLELRLRHVAGDTRFLAAPLTHRPTGHVVRRATGLPPRVFPSRTMGGSGCGRAGKLRVGSSADDRPSARPA